MSSEPDSVADRFRIICDEFLEPKGEWAVSRVQRVMHAAGVVRGELVLDLACNIGTFSFHSMRRGARPVSLDRNPNALREGRDAARRFDGTEIVCLCADALSIPIADNTFDLIINADFIEHTPDTAKERIFAEMFRVLKPGGRAIIYTPNLARIEWELRGEKLKFAIGLRKERAPRWQDFVDPDHFGLTTPGETRRRLERAGFVTRITYYEHHIPLISRIPILGSLTRSLLPARFSARFLIQATKP